MAANWIIPRLKVRNESNIESGLIISADYFLLIKQLQTKYGVAPEKLIAAGRSSYHPLTENDTKEGRATNRRTRIVILPNLDKFLALLSSN